MGLYGIVSHSVVMRTTEIGVRIALGADAGAIVGLIIRQAMRLVLAGITIGLAVSVAAARFARSLLFQTSAIGPITLLSVSVLFAIVGLAAAYLPARRAMRVDPVTAIRAY